MTAKKHVEKAWAIMLTHRDGKNRLAYSSDGDEHRCTFLLESGAKNRLRQLVRECSDLKPRVVPIEIREL